MIESLFRSASGARTGAPPAFPLLRRDTVWNCFRSGFAMLSTGRCQRFTLSLFCFYFSLPLPLPLPLPLYVMPALYKLFAICFFALFPARAVPGRPLPRFGLAVLRTSYPGRVWGSRSFFSVFYPLFLVPEPVSFKSSAVVVPRLSFAPFPAGSVPAFGTPCHRCRSGEMRSCPVSERSASIGKGRHRIRPYRCAGSAAFFR